MEEKVFTILYRLIASGQLPKEEAFYMMKLLFEKKETNMGAWEPMPNPVINPVWYDTKTGTGDLLLTSTSAPFKAGYCTTVTTANTEPINTTCTRDLDQEAKFETTTTIE
jgi:hypothetical protein